MPSIGHLIYGCCIIIPILYFTQDDKSFNYKAAFIFVINNLFGPDASQIFIGLPFHSILGFIIFAVPLSLFYSYISRFSLRKIDKGLRFRLEDDGIREVTWKNSFCLTVAGGISHFFIDQFYHFHKSMILWPDVRISHDEMLAWGGEAYHVVDPLMLVGFIVILFLMIFSLHTFERGYKESLILLLSVIGISVLLILTFGGEIYGGERELGVIIHSLIYVFIPLFLLFYAARNIREYPNEKHEIPRIDRNKLLIVIALISCIFSGFWFILSILVLITPNIVAVPLASAMGEDPAEFYMVLQLIAVLILFLTAPLLIGSIGLFFKINFCRYIVIGFYLIFFMLAFPIGISFFLCENNVKELFIKDS
ncbi:MAG: hypothetical protein ACTSR8_06475 [Promethearchaeota archaeon]